MKFSPIVAVALSAWSIPCSAHYFFPHLIVDGNFTGYFEYVRETTQGYMPQKGMYESTDFRCNTGSQDFASKTLVYDVQAGAELGFGTDFNALIEHPGPLSVYLSRAPGDVREYDGSGDWFKIYELSPLPGWTADGSIEWGVTGLGNFTFTLPSQTPAGQYLVRIEHIALHGAGEFGGAEFYYNCAQINVLGESTATPEPTVKIPGVYNGSEPGILFYMYRPDLNYTIPGPAVWPSANGNTTIQQAATTTGSGSTSQMPASTTPTSAVFVSTPSSFVAPYPFNNNTAAINATSTDSSYGPVTTVLPSLSVAAADAAAEVPPSDTVVVTQYVTSLQQSGSGAPTATECPDYTVTVTESSVVTVTVNIAN